MTVLYQLRLFKNISSHSVGCLLMLLTLSFIAEQKILILIKSSCAVLSFRDDDVVGVSVSKMSPPNLRSSRFSLLPSSSRGFSGLSPSPFAELFGEPSLGPMCSVFLWLVRAGFMS